MIRQQQLILALFSLVTGGTEAFTIATPCFASSRPVATCLWAEEETAAGDDDGAADILSSPAFLKRKVDVLKSDIEKAEQEAEELAKLVEEGKAEWGPQLDSLQVEYQNIQSRLSETNKKGDTMATVQVVREMLDVLDNYDRAFGAVKPETEEQEAIEAEYKATYDNIVDTFQELGVKEVETVGTEFNYEYHQAVMQRPSPDHEEGVVCEEFQKGFILGETLIRAAMVAVAA